MPQHNRSLTYDEKKAAEAAFTGLPFEPDWSDKARKVHLGITGVIEKKRKEAYHEIRPSQPLQANEVLLPFACQSTKPPVEEESVAYPFPFGNRPYFSSRSF